jgi:hypothetical protein
MFARLVYSVFRHCYSIQSQCFSSSAEYAALSEKCLPNKMRRNFDDHDVRAATDSLKGAIEETESLKSGIVFLCISLVKTF